MNRLYFLFLLAAGLLVLMAGHAAVPAPAPGKAHVWVFMMAGQSNMAGRGAVEACDTVINRRILTIDADGKLIYAQEPLHFYEPRMQGLDCGKAFAEALLPHVPRHVSILLIPTAVGGCPIRKWLNDEMHREVRMLTNFKEKAALGRQYGTIKGVLWHQGESDATENGIPQYREQLVRLLHVLRAATGDPSLPVLMGEIGAFSTTPDLFARINGIIHDVAAEDRRTAVAGTADLLDRGDHLHFNSEGQRTLGARYAEAFRKFMK